MTTRDISEFLEAFEVDELRRRGILRGDTNLLNGRSCKPLQDLMKEQGVDRLESSPHDWFLAADGRFQNPLSAEEKAGNIADLANVGNVFNMMNRVINPRFTRSEALAQPEEQLEQAQELRWSLERDMQHALRANLGQLEAGLSIADDGRERSVEAGRTDIVARDRDGRLVVIELKAGRAEPDSIAQILAYMASVAGNEKNPVRGILVAFDFAQRVELAAKAVPGLQLKQYSVRFTFKDR